MPWKILALPAAAVTEPVTMARAVPNTGDVHLNQLPPRSIKGDNVCIRISQQECELGIEPFVQIWPEKPLPAVEEEKGRQKSGSFREISWTNGKP